VKILKGRVKKEAKYDKIEV